ncbi:MAG: carboxypeptidase-like regulatory domain-containing protein [Bryobacteraceae bacterium]
MAALLVSCLGLWGQATTTSSIIGLVTDSTQAAIPGAEVTLTDLGTKIAHTVTTNESGRYIFPTLDPGTYSITVIKQGFAKSEIPSQVVEVSSTLTLNFKMELGTSSTTVEVRAVTGAELQTTNAAVGTTINGSALESLPNFGRDVTTLSVIQPGTTLGGFTAGAYSDQNSYTLDGGNNSDDMGGNVTGYVTNFTGLGGTQTNGNPSGVMPTPVESIEEIKVNSFNQTADFNASIGGQVVMATKRGTNQFHGSAYGYYFDTALGAANSWANDHTPDKAIGLPYTPIVSNHRDRFGFSIGGPITTKKFLGGKTYFFFNLEDLRFPNASNYEHVTPTALFRAGVIQVPNAAGTYVPYNLNPNPVILNGVTYPTAICPGGGCDPRGIGLNPVVNQIWSKYMPPPNDPLYGTAPADGYNVEGYLSTIRAPLTSNNYVGRIDHDFNDKWRFYSTYRDQRLISLTTNQVDIGGAIGSDKFGAPTALAPRNQIPDYFVTGLTTNISPTVTNTFVFNYIRNFWQWASDSSAQVPGTGLGGALEIGGEVANGLIPFNVNTQSVRQRFWDGQDKIYKDDVTIIKGNHLVQVGGSYQRNFDYHTRTDNGGGINNAVVYQSTSAGINFSSSPYIPATVPSSQYSTYETLYSEALGFVSQPQVAYTRSGANLALQPLGSTAFDKSIIPTYNEYVSDTWHMKPTFTLIYGLGYTIEMPPYEIDGKQIVAVDQSGQPISSANYFAEKQTQALQGQSYDPLLGFAGVRTIGTGLKYPYNPVYNEFSPRLAFAWNPNFDSGILGTVLGHGKTVLRGGYGRIYGRLNGVALVLTPLLGVGLIQAVTCQGPSMTGQCLGNNGVTPANVFRAGVDGANAPLPAPAPTLPQPFYPGVNGNATAGDAETLDPNYRPETTDNVTLTIQREVSRNSTIEVGYIGRKIRNEGQMLNLDAVPTMMTLNGQQFSSAFANMYISLCGLGPTCANNSPSSIAAQPFIESALGGANSAYCSAYASCTQALLANSKSLIAGDQVSDLWLAMSKASSWTLGRTTISGPLTAGGTGQLTGAGLLASNGFGSYNAMFVTYRMKEYHGLSFTSNFTWSRALGTATVAQSSSDYTALNPFNMQASYGPQSYDIPLIFNFAAYYRPDVYRTQKGIIGHIAGGWTISPLFTAQSGSPIGVGIIEGSCGVGAGCQAFGEVADSASAFGPVNENAVLNSKFTGGNSANYNVAGSGGVGTNNSQGINVFGNPAAVYSEFRRCIVGYDTSCGGDGNLRNLPTWNVDAQALKTIGIWKEGKVGATLSLQVTNVLNHVQPGTPSLSITAPTTFGRITTVANTPRNMEIGIRVFF